MLTVAVVIAGDDNLLGPLPNSLSFWDSWQLNSSILTFSPMNLTPPWHHLSLIGPFGVANVSLLSLSLIWFAICWN